MRRKSLTLFIHRITIFHEIRTGSIAVNTVAINDIEMLYHSHWFRHTYYPSMQRFNYFMMHSSEYLKKNHSSRQSTKIIDFIHKSSNINLSSSLPRLHQYRYSSTNESNPKHQYDDTQLEKRKVCLIIGAGPGVGGALIRRYAREGYIAGIVHC